MHSLAVAGHGTFAFIPDAKIVGTTFVNSVSNVLTTIFPTTKVSLTPINGSKFVGRSYGAYSEQDESWGRVIQYRADYVWCFALHIGADADTQQSVS